MDRLAAVLGLEGTELKIEDITERASEARKLPLRSVWIVSAKESDFFHPLVIFTSRKGIINSAQYDVYKQETRANTPKNGGFAYDTRVLDIAGIGECLVYVQRYPVPLRRAETVEGILAPGRRIPERGLSIVGTLQDQGTDFRIFLPFPDEDRIGSFPELKSMLYGSDYLDVSVLSISLVTVVRDSKIFERRDLREDKRRSFKSVGDVIPESGSDLLGDIVGQSVGEDSSRELDTTDWKFWFWIVVSTASLTAVALIPMRKLPLNSAGRS